MQSQTGAYGYGIDAAVPLDMGVIVGAIVGLALRFWQSQLHDFISATGHAHGK